MQLATGDDFWVHDERLVITETWHAELWLDTTEDVALYAKTWDAPNETAVQGADAHRLISPRPEGAVRLCYQKRSSWMSSPFTGLT
jgi:hypothetical protein